MGKFLSSQNISRILAVFMAVILWLFVTGDNITRTTPVRRIITDVPLSYENLQPGLAVVKMTQTVDMTLEGVPGALDELMVSDLEAYLDLSELEAGTHQVQVRGRAARGLTLISLAPRQVEVIIENLETELFPVEVEYFGDPAQGWVRESHSFHPMQIRLEAVQSVLDQIDQVVVHVDLSEKQSPFEIEVAPILYNASGEEISGVAMTPQKVSVVVHLSQTETDDD